MKGDFSRLTFRSGKHYSSVRLQQGRVLLDAEWNEQVDIQAQHDQAAARDVIGPSGAPLVSTERVQELPSQSCRGRLRSR